MKSRINAIFEHIHGRDFKIIVPKLIQFTLYLGFLRSNLSFEFDILGIVKFQSNLQGFGFILVLLVHLFDSLCFFD